MRASSSVWPSASFSDSLASSSSAGASGGCATSAFIAPTRSVAHRLDEPPRGAASRRASGWNGRPSGVEGDEERLDLGQHAGRRRRAIAAFGVAVRSGRDREQPVVALGAPRPLSAAPPRSRRAAGTARRCRAAAPRRQGRGRRAGRRPRRGRRQEAAVKRGQRLEGSGGGSHRWLGGALRQKTCLESMNRPALGTPVAPAGQGWRRDIAAPASALAKGSGGGKTESLPGTRGVAVRHVHGRTPFG